MSATPPLKVVNARENNLKSINLELEHDTFTVITGLSGSGKSSLAFGTLYAEGQRRYIETFSPYVRQFFDKVKKPDVDLIEHVRPAIAIQQRTRILSSRSTVGSLTHINDYLKVIWSNLSTAICPACGTKIQSWTPLSLAHHLFAELKDDAQQPFLLGAKLALNEDSKEIERLIALGFSRFYDPQRKEIVEGEEALKTINSNEAIVVLERFRLNATTLKRLQNGIEQAFSLTPGRCVVLPFDKGSKIPTKSFGGACCNKMPTLLPPRPALFSFNHPFGACPACKGFGNVLTIDLKRCIPDPQKSIDERCFACWSTDGTTWERRQLKKFCEKNNIATDIPWQKLPEAQRSLIINHKEKGFWGVLPWFKWMERKAYKMHVRVLLAKFREQTVCPECNGTRLKPEALAYTVDGKTIPESWNMPIGDLLVWINAQTKKGMTRQIKDIISPLISRLTYLNDLGLSYLTLERQARTLSGGETQRVNLAAALGSDLSSTHFILDEPSVGLHARDTERLISAVRSLHAKNNTVTVVEHDPDFINAADDIIEIGPETGEQGGEITYHGPISSWRGLPAPNPALFEKEKRKTKNKENLQIAGADIRNLKNISVKIPLGEIVSITGVSGSGKSTLAKEIIQAEWQNKQNNRPVKFVKAGFEHLAQVLLVDQSPLAKSPRANIATYSGIWEQIRTMLAATEEAQTRSLTKSSFSFNVDGGRCKACSGAGFIREDMQFLSDVYVPCEICLGKRFRATVLEVPLKGLNVDELLNSTVDRCAELFTENKAILRAVSTLQMLGLGHCRLGHPLSELSGGEAQRLKLVSIIEESSKGKSLLIFDEPTTGLHQRDVERLIALFKSLKTLGHSILCIEHNLLLIAASDWIIDLGPEGGAAGGKIIAEGSVDDLIKNYDTYTTQHLKKFLAECKSPAKIKAKKKAAKIAHSNMLTITGAREHNLKDITVELPLQKFVSITGVSGSGKSTIAKDIIFAEGQRRYLDCLSPYARQFIRTLERPDIDHISNILPTLCVYQHTFQPGAHSTVGTMSEVYNFLRLLFAKTGTQFCPSHPDRPIQGMSPEAIGVALKDRFSSSIRILAPIIRKKKGVHRQIFQRAIETEITEVRVDGVLGKPSHFIEGLEKSKPHSIEFVVARCNPKNIDLLSLQHAISLALALSSSEVSVLSDAGEELFSTERTCPVCKKGFFKPDPEDLSFHSSRGRCKKCNGEGVNAAGVACVECGGSKLGALGRNLKLWGKSIFEASQLTAPELLTFLETISFDSRTRAISAPVVRELTAKLKTLIGMGIEYLPLSRECTTLSGGELQRLRIATALGSPLTGVLYIFDEPSAGLHPLDNSKVLTLLRTLTDRGNSVIMIEHDAQSILESDYIIDVGPGGGKDGGNIVFSGSRDDFIDSKDSPTATAFRSQIIISQNQKRSAKDSLTLKNCSKNNIQNLSITVPLRQIVTVAGVSGSGKSTLVHGIIAETIESGKKNKESWNFKGNEILSSTKIDSLKFVDQKPIGTNARSTPASYLKIWDEVRSLFSRTTEAEIAGWGPSFFSYNSGKGRCPECKGLGRLKLEMNFLPDAFIPCETCNGARFTEDALSIRYKGLNIRDALNLTFEEAKSVFAHHRKIHHTLHQACELGLGYLTLGQSSSSLSGGESQRIKLVAELSGRATERHTLYLLDEPTTGLHKSDVVKLLKVLRELVNKGNSVLLIEHDSDVIAASDHVIEIGPGAGAAGGKIIFEGTPSLLLGTKTPWGKLLKMMQQRSAINVEHGGSRSCATNF